MKDIIFFHIGFPKTGTTYLQENFKEIKEINYIDPKKNKNLKYILKAICFFSDKKFEMSKVKIKENMNKINFHNVNLISSEAISFSIASFNFNYKKNIYRLLKIFKNYEINMFFLIRNQKTIMKSIYSEFNNTIQIISKENYRYDKFILNKSKNKIIFNNLNYFEFINFLEKNKKFCKYKVFFYEELESSNQSLNYSLSKYLKINFNPKKTKMNVTKKNQKGEYTIKKQSIIRSILGRWHLYLNSGNFFIIVFNKNFLRVLFKRLIRDFYFIKNSENNNISSNELIDKHIIDFFHKPNNKLVKYLNKKKLSKYNYI